jgi:hypothetical protein
MEVAVPAGEPTGSALRGPLPVIKTAGGAGLVNNQHQAAGAVMLAWPGEGPGPVIAVVRIAVRLFAPAAKARLLVVNTIPGCL